MTRPHSYSGRKAVGIAFALLLLLACDERSKASREIGEASEHSAQGASVPAPAADRRSLVLDQVLAGKDDGAGLTFGLVRHLAVEPSGSVVVEDAMGRAVVRLGPHGEFRDSLGRAGLGPGEYRYPYGVAALPDGSVAIRDNQPPSILIFDPQGRFVREWSLHDRVMYSEGLDVGISADRDGRIRLLVPFNRPPSVYELPEFGFVTLTRDGELVDSTPPLVVAGGGSGVWGPYQPRRHVAWHPDGFPVAGFSDRYDLEIQRPEGVVRIERRYEPVPVSEGEKQAEQVVRRWQRARGAVDVDDRPAPPDFKPPYSRILIARTGEIWVLRHGEGEQWGSRDLGNGLRYPLFREPIQADVFDATGRYLGTVEGDANIDPMVVSGDTVWAVVTGDQQEHYVARYIVR